MRCRNISVQVQQFMTVTTSCVVCAGVSGQFIEVDPVSQSRSGLPSILRSKSSQKSVSADI